MIYTFYSYKGGVGRSMAVANVAQWFYEQGLRVVIVDWDLEAPGLESFFITQDEVEKVRAKPGLIDMLLSYRDRYPLLPLTTQTPVAEAAASASAGVAEVIAEKLMDVATAGGAFVSNAQVFTGARPGAVAEDGARIPHKLDTLAAVEVLERELAPLAYSLYPLRRSSEGAGGRGGALWLLSAGWRTKERFADYGRAVQNFSWSEFYESYHGEAYFEWMRRQLTSEELADVVIIDSRTGITEMGGVCTRQLADVVVSFTAPNFQNLTGVVRMAASFKKKEVLEARARLEGGGERPLEVVVVPTRVENGETVLRNRFENKFKEQFGDVPAPFRILKKSFWDLLIPYVSTYAYEEKLAVGDLDGSTLLVNAYKNIAAHLVLLAPEGSALRVNLSEQLRATLGKMSPRVLFLEGEQRGNKHLLRLREELEREGISLWEKSAERSGAQGDTPLAPQGAGIDLVEHLLLPLTPDVARSETFLKQWRQARRHGVCVQLVSPTPGDAPRPEDLPLWLRDVHVYDPSEELDALVKVLKGSCMSARVPFMAPDLPENYVERAAEVGRIVDVLLKPRAASDGDAAGRDDDGTRDGGGAYARRVALCGPGGFGKSTLAKAVCHDERTLAAYGDGVMWVSLGERPDVDSALAALHTELTGEPRSQTQTRAWLVTAISSRLEGRNCLLVVNDVWAETDLEPFLDVMGSGSVLFTTRDRNIAARVSASEVSVEGMRPEESRAMLERCSGLNKEGVHDILNDGLENSVAELLGNAPLALKLAGAALRGRIDSGRDGGAGAVDPLVAIYREAQAHGAIAFDEKENDAPDTSVASSVAASLRLLTEEQADNFLKLANLLPDMSPPVEHLSILWGLDEEKTVKLAKRLDSLSLVHFDEKARTLRVSALIHSFLTAQRQDPSILNAKVEAAESRFARLTSEEQATARKVFARLVHLAAPGDTLPDRRGRYDFEKPDTRVRKLLPMLQNDGLVKLETGRGGEQTMAQIADDSLVQGWQRLRGWLDEDREFLLWRQSLAARVAEWESSKRHNSVVLLGRRELAAARAWRDRYKEDLSESEALFIVESARAESSRRRRAVFEYALVCGVLVLTAAALFIFYRGQLLAKREREDVLKTLSKARVPDTNPNSQPIGPQGDSYRDAISAYEGLLQNNPQSTEVLILLGNAYSGLGATDANATNAANAYAKAIDAYERAIAINPDLAEPHFGVATIFRVRADRGEATYYDKAIDEYTKAINIRQDYAEAYLGRADAYKAKAGSDPANYDLAVADYTVLLETLKLQDPDIYYKRGSVYKASGNNQGALADFQKVFELSDNAALRQIAQDNIVNLKVSPTPTPAPVAPRIYIQYNDPNDEAAMSQLAADLRAAGYRVGRPQLSGGVTIGDGDVRRFHDVDSAPAKLIAAAVTSSLINQGYSKTINLRPTLSGYPNVPQGNIEVWIASLRGVSDTSGEDEVTQEARGGETRGMRK